MSLQREHELDLLESYFDRLWLICRSITGEGLRESLRILQEIIPLKLHEIPSGTRVFDWEIPKEWNIREAYIIAPDGRKIADFKTNNLHIVNYSTPVDDRMKFDDLLPHLHTLPSQPYAIPYVTSYYKEYWGFCLDHRTFQTLPREGEYRVFIDSTLKDGSLTCGDLVLPGASDDEILFSTYLCHPSMANNELSGPLVTALLYRRLSRLKNRRYTYRFVYAPETIGAIAYLSINGQHLKEKVKAGYVVTCVGDPGPCTYKRSRLGNSVADKAAEYILSQRDCKGRKILDYFPYGSDERQYCSPGFNLPIGSIMRSMYGTYPQYHTSLDNKEYISFDSMVEMTDIYEEVCSLLENNYVYQNSIMNCEPHLGKRNLYPSKGGTAVDRTASVNMLWVLNYSDGNNSLLDIANKSQVPFNDLANVASHLERAGLIVNLCDGG